MDTDYEVEEILDRLSKLMSDISDLDEDTFLKRRTINLFKKQKKIMESFIKKDIGIEESSENKKKESTLQKIKGIEDVCDYDKILDLIYDNTTDDTELNLILCDKLEYIGFDINEGNDFSTKQGLFNYIVKEFIINIRHFELVPN